MAAALITGVSRMRGIAAAVAERLRRDGWSVGTVGWSPYDAEQHPDIDEQTDSDFQCDLGDPKEPMRLLDAAAAKLGPLSALVIAHTHDSGGGLFEMTPELIDRHMAVNVRGSLLLMRAFAEHLRDLRRPGRVVMFASGPPQSGAIAYAASKGALEWITYQAQSQALRRKAKRSGAPVDRFRANTKTWPRSLLGPRLPCGFCIWFEPREGSRDAGLLKQNTLLRPDRQGSSSELDERSNGARSPLRQAMSSRPASRARASRGRLRTRPAQSAAAPVREWR